MIGAFVRLVRSLIISGVAAVAIAFMSAPIIVAVMRGVHAGCHRSQVDGVTGWSCPDGIAYVAPVALFASAAATVLMILVNRSWTSYESPEQKTATGVLASRIAATITFTFGVLLLYYGPDPKGDVSPSAHIGCAILLVATAVAAILWSFRDDRPAAVVDALSGVATTTTLVVLLPFILLSSPLLVIAAGLFGTASALRWPPRDTPGTA